MDISSSMNMAGWISVKEISLSPYETLTCPEASGNLLLKSTNAGKIKYSRCETYELPPAWRSSKAFIRIQIKRWKFIYESGLSSKRHDAEVFIHQDIHSSLMSARDRAMKMFKSLVDTAEGVVSWLYSKHLCVLDVLAYIAGLNYASVVTAAKLTKEMYYKEFMQLLETYEDYVGILQRHVEMEFLRAVSQSNAVTTPFSDAKKCMKITAGLLRNWNERETFYCGKSAKFKGIQTFSDFLPAEDDSQECAVCFDIILEGRCDLAILSQCFHVFCSPCLKKWFEDNNTCPLCRQKSYWMSEEFYLDRQYQISRLQQQEAVRETPETNHQ